jgi:excisionase family DNA binding protein
MQFAGPVERSLSMPGDLSPQHTAPQGHMTTDHPPLPQLVFTAAEAAQILKTSTKTVYRLVQRDLLKTPKTLRHLRITRKSLEEFLATTTGEVL